MRLTLDLRAILSIDETRKRLAEIKSCRMIDRDHCERPRRPGEREYVVVDPDEMTRRIAEAFYGPGGRDRAMAMIALGTWGRDRRLVVVAVPP